MNYWVFVIRDDQFIFDKRIEHKKWPLYRATKFRKFIQIGDNVVFYQAGKHGQKFLGTAVIKSRSKPIPNKMDYYVDMYRIKIWNNAPSIRNLIPNLEFIKNKVSWGLSLQGGVLKINEKDRAVILKEAKKLKQKKK